MYESFYGFNEKPFSLLPDPGFLFLGEGHSSALAAFEYALLNGAGLAVLTGEIGCGKTTLIRQLLNEVGDETSVGLISCTHRSLGELLQWVLLAFGEEYKGGTRAELYDVFVKFLISEYASGRRTLLIVDEAQNMSPELLEDLRLLLNINADKDLLLQVLLVGQPELRRELRAPGLAQFSNRIGIDYHLSPLNPEETEQYIRHRLTVAGGDPELFEPAACARVAEHSGGVPRLINLLCDSVLTYAFGGKMARVEAELVDEVVRDRIAGGLSPLAGRGPAAVVPERRADMGTGGTSVFPIGSASRADDTAYPSAARDFGRDEGEPDLAVVERVRSETEPVHPAAPRPAVASGYGADVASAVAAAVSNGVADEAGLPGQAQAEASPDSEPERDLLRQLFGSLRERDA